MLHITNTQNMAPWYQYEFSIWYENFDDQTKKSVWIWPGIESDKGEPDITCMGADSVSHRRGVWMNGYILVFERYSDKLPPICHVKV